MADTESYPYETRLDVRYDHLEVIDLAEVINGVTHPWFNQTLCQVDESVVRLGVVKGEYHWHRHEKEEEFFYVVSGQFLIDLQDRTIDLTPGIRVVIQMDYMHSPLANEIS